MSTAAAQEPTEENALFLRWTFLLLQGGTAVLRELLDNAHPPQNIVQSLAPHKISLLKMKSKEIIRPEQYYQVFPQHGFPPDSSTFDITLLICLLRNVCGLNKNHPAWNQPPQPTDISTEDDLVRLQALRNECAHFARPTMTMATYQQKSTELETVLLRLGKTMPDLPNKIAAIKTRTIDPSKERDLKNIIQSWELRDYKLSDIENIKLEVQWHRTTIQAQEKSVQELQLKVDTMGERNDARKKEDEKVKADFQKMKSKIPTVRQNINDLKKKSRSHSKALKRSKETQQQQGDQINEFMKAIQELKKQIPPEMKALIERTKVFVEKVQSDCPYVETTVHRKAKETLQEHNILVLSGHPGEGKTTMAAKLMLEISSPERCLKLREPSDWKFIEIGEMPVDVVLVDDIFGTGTMDSTLVREWEKFLPDMAQAAKKGRVKIIITCRHSVLGDTKDAIHSPVFDDKHEIHLTSEKLSVEEKYQMLEAHLHVANRQVGESLITACVLASAGIDLDNLVLSSGISFGFPQCVTMFAKNEDIFKQKENFFSKPAAVFRNYIEELFKDEKKFLALLFIWAQPSKRIGMSDLDLSSTSHELRNLAKQFGYDLKQKLVKVVRNSLKNHTNGLVVFNDRTGDYSFSHDVIGDTIGLVVGKKYPEEILRLCDRKFVVNYITTDDSRRDKSHMHVERYLYRQMSEKILHLFLNPRIKRFVSEFKPFKRYGKCSNTISSSYVLDMGLIFIDAFQNKTFISDFVQLLEDQKFKDQSQRLLTLPMMSMSGHFLGRGVVTDDIEVTLPDYLLLHGRSLLLQEIIKSNTKGKVCSQKHDIGLSMMIGVHSANKPVVDFLLEHGGEVTEEVVYIAAMANDTELLEMILDKKTPTHTQKSRIVNGNSALTSSAKKGLVSSVKCLVEKGEDISFKNKDGYNALAKAVIYNNIEVCQILISAGSPLNEKFGKFKRTPLHIACDKGWDDIARLLLNSGASPKIRDAKGHFPIHCAAFRNHIGVVRGILEHDINLAKQRIVSYRKESPVKGMTVFHVAVMKDLNELIENIIELGADPNVQDYYGRTPLLYAVSLGKVFPALERVSDINKPEKQGLTPLHVALIRSDKNMAIRFLDNIEDLNVNATDRYGITPLHVAFQRQLRGIAFRMILYHRADMRIKTKKGWSILNNDNKEEIEEILDSILQNLSVQDGKRLLEYF